LCNIDVSIKPRLTSSEGSLGLGFLTISLGLLDGCLGIDLGDFTILLTLASGFTNTTFSLSFSNINASLINSTFVSLSGERLKVAGLRGIAEPRRWAVSILLTLEVLDIPGAN
jgi:hypothetical protein